MGGMSDGCRIPAGKRGMSVVEALILLALAALVAAIAVPAARQNAVKARAAACAGQLDLLSRGCAAWASERGGFPESAEALVPDYLKAVPSCPSGGTYTLGTPEGDPPRCSVPGHGL